MNPPEKIIVAVTGASGSIYARLLLEALLQADTVTDIALIVSENGREVAKYEQVKLPVAHPKITRYDNDDLFAPVASGSARYDAMIVIPCSMGSIGRMAAGVSLDLIGRAADVTLKERRPLILVPREAPYSTIHLRNLLTLSECSAVIMPASPAFYALPDGIESLCRSVVERITSLLGMETLRYCWGKPGKV